MLSAPRYVVVATGPGSSEWSRQILYVLVGKLLCKEFRVRVGLILDSKVLGVKLSSLHSLYEWNEFPTCFGCEVVNVYL
jgi:hypothetical protein